VQAGLPGDACLAPPSTLSDRATEVFELFRSCETQVLSTFGGVSGINHGEVRRKAAECGVPLGPEFWDLFSVLEAAWRVEMNPKPKDEADGG
jgi:hypothetical protein